MKQERLAFLADNPFYTKRFAFHVGRRGRASSISDVAKELRLDWHTVKALEKQYMGEQLRRAGTPGPTVLGLDEVSIKKGHTYRIVVSDLVRQRPLWFGGTDRSEASLDEFFTWLDPRKSIRIRHLTLDGRRALKTLLAANRRLNTAYLLKESFGQLWAYQRGGWARRFVDQWRAALKRAVRPYDKFAAMIERHWDGIAAYGHPQNKVALGFVEGVNNKIRSGPP